MRRIILNFHGIGTPRRDLEPGEARYWVSEDQFVQAVELADTHADRVETSFTFDDGNLSDFDIAAPHLADRGLTAVFFVLADRIDTAGSLEADQIRQLAGAGFGIGSHGAAHVNWRRLDKDGLRRELIEAPLRIADCASQPVTEAGIPFGSYDRGVLREIRTAGFEAAYCSDPGPWRDGDDPIPRTSPTRDMTREMLEDVIVGRFNPWRDGVRILKRSVKRLR